MAARGPQRAAPFEMPRVLVVHGDREEVEILDEHLRRAGHRVECTTNADRALDAARARRPDVVLLDAQLPGGTPARMALAFGADARTRGLPLIAIAAPDADEALLRAGMTEVLTRPFTVAELLRCVERTICRLTSGAFVSSSATLPSAS